MSEQIHRIVVIAILYLVLAPALQALEPVGLEKNREKYPLGLSLEILEDRKGDLTFQEVNDPKRERQWYKSESEAPNFQFSRSTYWLRLKVHNPFQEQKNMLLDLAWTHHDYLEVYISKDGETIKEVKTGDRLRFDTREKTHRNFIFDIIFPPAETLTIHMRVGSWDGFHGPLPLALWEHDAFAAEDSTQVYFLGLLLGILGVMAAYNLFLYFSLRDIGYLFYVLHLIGITLWLSTKFGLSFMYFWPDSPWWGNQVLPASLGFGSIFLMLFSRVYLDTPRYTPKLDKALLFLAGIFFINTVLPFFGLFATSFRIYFPGTVAAHLALLIAGIFSFKQGHRPARYFLLAFFVMIAGGILIVIRAVDLLPTNFLTENVFIFGLVLEIVLFSLGLADRINAIQERALHIQKKAAESLELKVNERTQELAQANEKLQQADRAKTRFFANISHEFRTPLTLIIAPVESILNGDYGATLNKQNTIFNSILQNSLRLLRLINNLLDFTKIEAGRMNIKKEKTDISKFLDYQKVSVESGARSKGLEIEFHDKTGGLVAYIDRDLMEKAVMNLLSNAFKFTPENGKISVRLETSDQESFSISVQDNGIGVPEDKLETIFQRFSQVDESTSRKYEGTGIGLSLTKEIAELHGGSISVESKPDQGATFTLHIPLGLPRAGNALNEALEDIRQSEGIESLEEVKKYLMADVPPINIEGANGSETETVEAETDAETETEATEENEADTEDPAPKHRVLLVEDNADMRSFITTLLVREYIVDTAENGKVGLARAQEIIPDLILSDVMMPEMNGYELAHAIKSGPTTKDIPIIMLSAKADVLHRIEGLEYGADDYLPKPFNSIELMTRIRNQIAGKKLERELKKEKQERDLEFLQASVIQKTILTPRKAINKLDNLEIEFSYLPMNGQVSGDYYNISRTKDGTTSIFIADATGHGTQAALTTMQIDVLYKESLVKEFPSERFQYVNNKFVTEIHSKNFFTAINVDIQDNTMRYSCAGHPEQYLIRPATKEIKTITARGGIIGVREDKIFEMKETPVESGDMLLLFSDGIFEVFNRKSEEFGEERFQNLIQQGVDQGLYTRPINNIIDSIMEGLDEYREGVPFEDDITLFGIRMK